MDPAFVEHTKHDVDDHQRRKDQPGFGGERALKLRRVAGVVAANGVRHADGLPGLRDDLDRMAERIPRREVEAQRGRGKLLLMRQQQRRGGFLEPRDGRQRHLRVVGAGHPQQPQHAGVLLPRGVGFQHHPILVGLPEDGGDLALPEGVVQRVLDRLHRHTQPHRRVSVDVDERAESVLLLVGGDVAQRRQRGQFGQQPRRPGRELHRVGIHQRVLELGATDAGADLNVLHRLEIGGQARLPGDGPLQTSNHDIGGIAAGDRAQRDGEAARVRRRVDRAGPNERDHPRYRRVFAHDVRQPCLHIDQMRDRNTLGRLGHRQQHAGILARQEAFRHDRVQPDRANQRGQTDQQHETLITERPPQTMPIARLHLVEPSLAPTREAAGPFLRRRAQQPAAHHRRQGQRHHRRDDHRDRERDGEFLEQPSHDAGHEQQRNEHRDQGHRQRNDGETDLRRAAIGGLQRLHPLFDIANHVFDHHDRVVDHEPAGDGQRHEGKIVQAIAQQRHDAERADQRQRQRHRRNERGPRRPQEHENNPDHQQDRQSQRILHIQHRCADCFGSVGDDGQIDAGRDRPLQARQRGLDQVHRPHDVGAGLALNIQYHRLRAVVFGGNTVILHPRDHIAHRRQFDRRTIAPRDRQILVRRGIDQLVVGAQRVAQARPVETALGAIDVGGSDGAANILHRKPISREPSGIDAHAHGWAHAALNGDAANALDLRQFGLQQRVGGVADDVDGDGVRRQCQGQDGRVGRVHLGINRGVRQRRGQRAGRGVDRRLHVLRR